MLFRIDLPRAYRSFALEYMAPELRSQVSRMLIWDWSLTYLSRNPSDMSPSPVSFVMKASLMLRG